MCSNNRQESKETLRINTLKVYSEALEDDPEVSDQTYTSADTSINSSKLPVIYRLVKIPKGSVFLDYGGGRFDNGIEYLNKIWKEWFYVSESSISLRSKEG